MKTYNKLVRDKIPEIIESKGERCVTHIANDSEYKVKLIEKLQEEVSEYIEDPTPEELADILEVIQGLAVSLGISWEELERIRQKKEKERGGFAKRIILEKS